jgi:protein phosphatase
VAVAALVVLVAGAIGTYVWALGHWFVGVDGAGSSEHVAVFRGLNVSIVGFDFYEVDQGTRLLLTDLTPAARNRVQGGITANDPTDADRILTALRAQRLPVCRVSEQQSGSTAAPTTPPAAPEPATPTEPAPPVTSDVPSPPDASSSSPARTTSSPEPGVDCREAD